MPSDKEDWRLLRTRRSTEMEKILTRMALVSSLPGKGIVWIDCGGDVRNSKMSNNSIFDVSCPFLCSNHLSFFSVNHLKSVIHSRLVLALWETGEEAYPYQEQSREERATRSTRSPTGQAFKVRGSPV